MATQKHKVYIDTTTTGLASIIEHNLSTTPLIFITDYETGQEVYVSFYDPRLSEVKVLDKDNVQITFASSFKGYIYFYKISVDSPSNQDRLTALEEKYIELLESTGNFTNKDQWIQMNTLMSKQLEVLESQVRILQNQVNLISDTVDKL